MKDYNSLSSQHRIIYLTQSGSESTRAGHIETEIDKNSFEAVWRLPSSIHPILLFQDDVMQFVERSAQKLLIKLAIKRLPHTTQAIFYSLQGHFASNSYISRIQMSAFQAYAGAAKGHYWTIVHDCRPDSALCFDQESLTHPVQAVSKISIREKITVSYSGLLKLDECQAFISRAWGFNCTCSKCSGSDSLRAISNYPLGMIEDLDGEVSDVSVHRIVMPATAETLVSLYEPEKLYGEIRDAYMLTALEYAYVRDRDKMQKWATMTLEGSAIAQGKHHQYFKCILALSMDLEHHDA